MLSEMPNSLATWTTRFMPICAAMRTVIRLRDFSRPLRTVSGAEEVAAVVAGPPDRLAVARIVFERRVLDDGRGREARSPSPRDRRTA